MKPAPFSRSAIILLLASATALFALSVILNAYETLPAPNAYTPGSYSKSAIGYAGLYDLLQRFERPVSRSSGNALAAAGTHGTLIVAEPDLRRTDDLDDVKLMRAPRLLLVLPKWRGAKNKERPAWIMDAELVPLFHAQQILGLVTDPSSSVYRTAWPEDWKVNGIGFTPAGKGAVQLIHSPKIRPIVGTAQGTLVGELRVGAQKIWIISDPDVLANHGLPNGDNAAFMVALIDTIRFWENTDASAPIVFDETVHGFRQAQNSPLKLLFRFPFSVVAALLCCTAALLLWAGVGRFGVPAVEAPALDFGKGSLIANSARLLDYAGHHSVTIKRYVRMTVRSAAQSLHAPEGLDEAALIAWLERLGRARRTNRSCARIVQATFNSEADGKENLPHLFECAKEIHLWKGEILNGSSTDRQHR